MNVTTKEGKHLFAPDCGSVLRCEPDGSNLEIFATGLRNPQELAFDNYGNLFTCDNNSDGGDKARWVHVVEGGDSGWRMGYQYLDFPTSRGPWNAEKLWHPRWDGQAAYIVPPIINISDGPSGLAHDPGTGLPAKYRDHFFLADFRGGAGNSGVRSFANKPKGASFELVDAAAVRLVRPRHRRRLRPRRRRCTSPTGSTAGTRPARGGSGRSPSQETDPKVAGGQDAAGRGDGQAAGRGAGEAPRPRRPAGPAQRPSIELADRAIAEAQSRRTTAKVGTDVTAPRPTPATSRQAASKSRSADEPTLARVHAIWAIGQVDRRSPIRSGVLDELDEGR